MNFPNSACVSHSFLLFLPQSIHFLNHIYGVMCVYMYWYVITWTDMWLNELICGYLWLYLLICGYMYWYVVIFTDMWSYVVICTDVIISRDEFHCICYILQNKTLESWICSYIYWYVVMCGNMWLNVLSCGCWGCRHCTGMGWWQEVNLIRPIKLIELTPFANEQRRAHCSLTCFCSSWAIIHHIHPIITSIPIHHPSHPSLFTIHHIHPHPPHPSP